MEGAVVTVNDEKAKCDCGQDANVWENGKTFCVECYLKKMRAKQNA